MLYHVSDLFYHLLTYYTYIIHDKMISIGRIMQNNHHIEKEQDIFHLSLEEILKYERNGYMTTEDYSSMVKKHVDQFEAASALQSPKCILSPYFSCLSVSAKTNKENKLGSQLKMKGIGITTGTVEGTAIVINQNDFNAFKGITLEEDDILVVDYTDPSYSTLLYACKGIICSNGSFLSHVAMIARNYSIPCIMNVYDVTNRIKSGSRIKMDCKTGLIEILEDVYEYEENY